jgi:hypothetical protein
VAARRRPRRRLRLAAAGRGDRRGAAPAAYGELRVALRELGIGTEDPLWLDHASGRPEEPIGSFVARERLTRRLVVVTDHALHVFEHPEGPQLLKLLRRPDPRDDSFDLLRKCMVSVWQGDSTDEVATVLTSEVHRARFGPATGGVWWRLRLPGLTLRGYSEGYAEEAVVEMWLGERLTTTWLHASDRVRRNRAVAGRIGVVGGGAVLLAGGVLALVGTLPLVLPAGMAAVGAAALGGAFVPDLAAELSARGRRLGAWRPAQRGTSSPTGTGAVSVLPSGGSGHAQAASYAQDGA